MGHTIEVSIGGPRTFVIWSNRSWGSDVEVELRRDVNWRERIEIDPATHHGDPYIKGTCVPVSVNVGSIADGDTPQQILDAWPQLTGDDIRAALKFAAEAVNNADCVPFHPDAGQ
jgi:uncharacterized protein (DUF433 family)